jgi:hypothetical protein
MTTRMDKAFSELEEKSPFVCESCDVQYRHEHDTETGKVKTGDAEGTRGRQTSTKYDPSPSGA